MATAVSKRNHFWFGTIDSMRWFPTPNSGADVTSEGWESGGALLDGGGYQAHSFGSHGNYIYEWPPSSSQKTAQVMKSYRDGTFGRGLLYFVDPLQFHTNILPPYWADPSMTLDNEVLNLAKEPASVHVTEEPTPNPDIYGLPVKSARYDLDDVLSGWRGTGKALFVPIPKDHSLLFGAMYTHTGLGRVLMRKVYHDGELGPALEVPARSTAAVEVADIVADSSDSKGVYLFIGKTGIGAGSVTLSAMIGRLIETRKTTTQSIATNLFTNPRLKGDGTWAEVRRNRFVNPVISSPSTSGFTVVPGTGGAASLSNPGAITPPSGTGASFAVRATWTTSSSGGFPDLLTDSLPIQPSEGVPYSLWARRSTPGVLRLRVYWLGETTIIHESSPVLAANQWYLFEGVTPVRPSAAEVRFGIAPANGEYPTAGFFIDATWFTSDPQRIRFDGSSPDFSVDPDMRTRWLGAENASESVMEIETVAGMTAMNCVAGVSTKNGKPTVRLIPNANNTASYVFFAIPASARALGTLRATAILDAPITGPTVQPGRLQVNDPYQNSDATPNEAGTYSRSLVYSDLTGAYRALLRHGGGLGSGDVWWTDIGLFAGDYTGPWFSGSSGGVVIDGKNYTPRWDGEPNNSTSTAWTPTPELDRLREDPWIGGQGHSGCRFAGVPTYVKYSGVNGGQVGFAATFREVGHWTYN